jgi:cobalt-precorrin 5A hydrolase/precorrin-3B C17-methyltransferase
MTPAIIVLNAASVPLGRQIQAILPGSTLYGLANRTQAVDIPFAQFGETLRSLFQAGTPIIGICAAGILIRTIAPLLTNKWQEPPVLAVAEDGSAVVPLLGGLHGVNDLARQIAAQLQVAAAITTTGDLRFRTTLLDPPDGYTLANPPDAKQFIADLLAGESVKLVGSADWLTNSQLPIAPTAALTIQVTEQVGNPAPTVLVYHPRTIVIGWYREPQLEPQPESQPESQPEFPLDISDLVQAKLTELGLVPQALAGIFAQRSQAVDPELQTMVRSLNLPLRYCFDSERDATPTAESIALAATGTSGKLLATGENFAIAQAVTPIDLTQVGTPPGRLAIVGTGPGNAGWMTPEVRTVLAATTDWVGYKTYLDLAEPLRTHQHRHESDNREELDRARAALNLAATGRSVAVISSGDPGIFAMAAAVFEVIDRDQNPHWQAIDIQVCPGISAMQAAAAQVGAPLGHDFCVISLSDRLKPWSMIEQRLAAAAQADFVIALYNPISSQRTWQLSQAREILLQFRSSQTPIVLGKNLGRSGQTVQVKRLSELQPDDADMRTVILVGSSQTRLIEREIGLPFVYTPRQYDTT